MTHHHLKASGATCHWGFFDATLKPKLTVRSGDTVTVDTVTGAPDVHPRPEAGFSTPPEMADVHANAEKTLPGHILTGPIAIEGAQPGDVLEVRIEDVQFRQDWGYNVIRPLAGTLQSDFQSVRTRGKIRNGIRAVRVADDAANCASVGLGQRNRRAG